MDQAAHITLRDLLLLVWQQKIDVEALVAILREVFEKMTNVEEAEHEFWKAVAVCDKTT